MFNHEEIILGVKTFVIAKIKNSLARLFTPLPPQFLFIYRGVNNGTDIYMSTLYSSRANAGQAEWNSYKN